MHPSKAEFVLKEMSENSATMITDQSTDRGTDIYLSVATMPEELELFPVFLVETDSVKAVFRSVTQVALLRMRRKPVSIWV